MEIQTIVWIIYFFLSISTFILWMWNLRIDNVLVDYPEYRKEKEELHYNVELSKFDLIFASFVVSFVPLLNIILIGISIKDLYKYYFIIKKELDG